MEGSLNEGISEQKLSDSYSLFPNHPLQEYTLSHCTERYAFVAVPLMTSGKPI